MDNLDKIKKISKNFEVLCSALLVCVPLYYLVFWVFINVLPTSFITVNTAVVPLVDNEVSPALQMAGFVASLLPLSALTYILLKVRRLFGHYKQGEIFSFSHVELFKKTAWGLVFWVVFSMIYDSAKSIIFSFGNPPGSRVVTVGFGSSEITTLITAGMVLMIAWVMDEGRLLHEETTLTI
ncbi:DUF2975 domain-containing protein [uncultured Desulfuromonas sp.]|uniref:DUF2975 domain-containing protein n=1 Tax=uncultured Desulfuromonas sp. TaxID=181013 RepID=UPI00374D0F25